MTGRSVAFPGVSPWASQAGNGARASPSHLPRGQARRGGRRPRRSGPPLAGTAAPVTVTMVLAASVANEEPLDGRILQARTGHWHARAAGPQVASRVSYGQLVARPTVPVAHTGGCSLLKRRPTGAFCTRSGSNSRARGTFFLRLGALIRTQPGRCQWCQIMAERLAIFDLPVGLYIGSCFC
jgi:hypothetical protein